MGLEPITKDLQSTVLPIILFDLFSTLWRIFFYIEGISKYRTSNLVWLFSFLDFFLIIGTSSFFS